MGFGVWGLGFEVWGLGLKGYQLSPSRTGKGKYPCAGRAANADGNGGDAAANAGAGARAANADGNGGDAEGNAPPPEG